MPTGNLRRILKAAVETFVSARERQAKREIATAMLRYDDATLRQYGYDRATLRRQQDGG